jgi:hypothetical protein
MNEKSINVSLFEEFQNLYYNKCFKIAFYINAAYLVIAIVLTLTIFRDFNDFLVYYQVGGQFLTDINNLYNPMNYKWAFRYFPLFGLIFVPFYLMGFNVGYIIAQIIGFIMNILISIYIFRIISLLNPDRTKKEYDRQILFISIFLISVPQLYNYILGQINLYITLLILISLFLFLKYNKLRWNLISSIILGCTTILKPITLFIIPFILLIKVDLTKKKIEINWKKSLIRIFGALIPILLNFILFLLFPSLLEGFIEINLMGTNPIDLNHSFSITKLIINAFSFFNIGFNQLLILLFTLLIVMGSGFFIYIIRKNNKNSIIHGYVMGIVTMLLVYFDSWDHHLLILTPLLLINIFTISPNSNVAKKNFIPSFFFFSFTDLACVGLWYLLENWFPFNFIPTIFLILTFIGSSKYLLKTKNSLK